ncbi:MAG: antibiotic biosynthesis monooxygenase [Rhodobacteraceae bacterium]|nr:antibiotic biosynthesis monooxygenase [Paracoccaceae bacterium]
MFAVCVSFEIHRSDFKSFLEKMATQAETSLSLEPGCHRFDVCHDGQAQVFLYELYTDAAAFNEHLASAHFKAFDVAVSPMVAAKSVQTFENVAVGSD